MNAVAAQDCSGHEPRDQDVGHEFDVGRGVQRPVERVEYLGQRVNGAAAPWATRNRVVRAGIRRAIPAAAKRSSAANGAAMVGRIKVYMMCSRRSVLCNPW